MHLLFIILGWLLTAVFIDIMMIHVHRQDLDGALIGTALAIVSMVINLVCALHWAFTT